MTKVENTQFGLSTHIVNKIKRIFSQHQNIESACIYGSRAKGTYKPSSDIDICIDAPDLEYSEYVRLCNELDDLLLPYEIDLTLKSDIDNPDLLDHINSIGIPIQ